MKVISKSNDDSFNMTTKHNHVKLSNFNSDKLDYVILVLVDTVSMISNSS